MKMSAFPLTVAGFPNLATTQLLMSAAGGLNLPVPTNANSPKDLSNVSPTSIASLAGVPRVPALPSDLSLAAGHHPSGAYLPPHLAANMSPAGLIDPRILYSAINGGYDVKESADAALAWRQIAAQAQQAASAGILSYDAHTAAMAASFSYPSSYPAMDLNGARRKNATRETTSTLKAWLYEHRKNPYPTKGEKIMLAIITKMTLTQVSTWFANARRRLKKENKMTWSPRNRTDDGSSIDDEDKPDNEDGVVGDDDDDVSIDLSDFETEGNSPTKPPKSAALQSMLQSAPAAAVPSQSAVSSPEIDAQASSGKPRIWSIADVAANNQPTSSPQRPVHHKSSVRSRPYPMPNNTAFRPWFDSSYRQLVGHHAASAILSNPMMSAARPTTMSSLPIAHIPSLSASPTDSRPLLSSPSSPPSTEAKTAERTIQLATIPALSRKQVRERSLSPPASSLKHDQQH